MVSLLRQAISLAIYILRGPEETIVFYFHLSHLVLKDGQQQNVCQIMSKNVRNSIFIFLIWLSCWPVTESVSPTLRKPNSATCIFCVKKNIKIHKPNKSQWNMIQNHHNVQLSMIRQMLFSDFCCRKCFLMVTARSQPVKYLYLKQIDKFTNTFTNVWHPRLLVFDCEKVFFSDPNMLWYFQCLWYKIKILPVFMI